MRACNSEPKVADSCWESFSHRIRWHNAQRALGGSVGFVMDFDARYNLLRVTLEGRVTDPILLDAYTSVARYVEIHGPCRAVVDVSAATKFDVSSHAIRDLTRRPPAIPKGYMRVFVAPLDSMYGMVRMFQILTELTRPELHVVRSIGEAYRLLRVESPEFSPVSEQ